jgi:hypothetical protein
MEKPGHILFHVTIAQSFVLVFCITTRHDLQGFRPPRITQDVKSPEGI